jgi:hypothetical protein
MNVGCFIPSFTCRPKGYTRVSHWSTIPSHVSDVGYFSYRRLVVLRSCTQLQPMPEVRGITQLQPMPEVRGISWFVIQAARVQAFSSLVLKPMCSFHCHCKPVLKLRQLNSSHPKQERSLFLNNTVWLFSNYSELKCWCTVVNSWRTIEGQMTRSYGVRNIRPSGSTVLSDDCTKTDVTGHNVTFLTPY